MSNSTHPIWDMAEFQHEREFIFDTDPLLTATQFTEKHPTNHTPLRIENRAIWYSKHRMVTVNQKVVDGHMQNVFHTSTLAAVCYGFDQAEPEPSTLGSDTEEGGDQPVQKLFGKIRDQRLHRQAGGERLSSLQWYNSMDSGYENRVPNVYSSTRLDREHSCYLIKNGEYLEQHGPDPRDNVRIRCGKYKVIIKDEHTAVLTR